MEFENAFQDQTHNQDYFGCQSLEPHVQLQTVETISEIENRNLIPHYRYPATRQSSEQSTPSDTPPYRRRYDPRVPPSGRSRDHLQHDFANLNLTHTNDAHQRPSSTFAPDAGRPRAKPPDSTPSASAQAKLPLPQYFLVKYLGRTPCAQLWGAKAVRAPIDDMVRAARQLPSMDELPTLEACVNTHGFTLAHRQSPARSRHHRSPERHQHGLIPLENISYVMHDVKYSKVASCIVLRSVKGSPSPDRQFVSEMLTECYGFLFQSKEYAHRFAQALAEAFNVQKQSARPARPPREERRESRSPQRRSRHRHARHSSKHEERYLRDSQV